MAPANFALAFEIGGNGMNAIRHLALGFFLLSAAALTASAAEPATKPATENVMLLMTDGLRWQEVFGGAEEILMTKENGGVTDVDALKKDYWRDTPEARREALMPFLWTVVAKQGQIYGNQAKGSVAEVTNGMNFSYPGYNETLCGFADPRIDSNDKNLNPNVTVFEWLNRKPAYSAARWRPSACWDVFPYIFNRRALRILRQRRLRSAYRSASSRRGSSCSIAQGRNDALLARRAVRLVHVPRGAGISQGSKSRGLFFLSLNETDAGATTADTTMYLTAAHAADTYFKTLWETHASRCREYQGKTSLIFVPDHGRGDAPVEWKNHGKKVPRSEFIWMAFLGPDTPPLGERSNVPTITQSQVAATLAALLGEDYAAAVPQAGKPIADVVGSRSNSDTRRYLPPDAVRNRAAFLTARRISRGELECTVPCCGWSMAVSAPAPSDAIAMPKVLDPRLKIELFAADPDIVTPTGIAVDARGRVLVVESHTHFRPPDYEGPPADRIRMFEDTDGDGQADRITTFFEGTTWTMNLGVHPDGSVYVATRSEIFRLRDTDDDGRADERTPIVHLETKGDYPHNGLSGFAFDFDGNVYFGLGENLGAEFKLIGTDGSMASELEGGQIYRCRADGTRARDGRLWVLESVPRGVRHVRSAVRRRQRSRFAAPLPADAHRAGRQLWLSLSQRPQGSASVHGLERRTARHAADGGRHGRGALGRAGLRIRPTCRPNMSATCWSPVGATIASSDFTWSRAAPAFVPRCRRS